ncbi:Uncharacterised protein [Kingella kingae]|nr:Uncharacterised protein [Kingella kingae]
MNNNVNSSYIGNINLWIGFLNDYIGVASKCEIFMKQYKVSACIFCNI